MAGTVFPAIIKASYDPSGGFPKMVEDARRSGLAIKQAFQQDFDQLGNIIKQAMQPALNSGKIDLGLNELRQAAAEAKVATLSLQQLQRTTALLAAETGDTSEKTRLFMKAIEAKIVLSRQAEQAVNSEVATYSRLQAALGASESKVSNLASAYQNLERAKYAQAAADAKVEAGGNRFRANFDAALQQSGVGRTSGKSAAQSADVFTEFERNERAAREYAASLELLRQAEASAANGADMIAAAYRGTALEAGRVAKSARDSAQVFIESERDAARATEERRKEMALAAQQQQAAQQQLADAAARLRGQIDPLYAAQRRFDDELMTADRLLEAGVISTREYAAAQTLAQNNLQTASAAIHQQGEALKRGTDAYGIHNASLRGSRQAMVQTGQQMQDLAISLYSGQRASTVFAQQLPQLAFALTSLEGSTNKTANSIGVFASMLSGPLGTIALVAASMGLGILVERLFSAEDAADKSGNAISRLADRLDFTKNSYSALIDVVNEYNRSQERSEAITYAAAEAARVEAARLLEKAEAQLLARPTIDSVALAKAGIDPTYAMSNEGIIVGNLQKRIDKLKNDLQNAKKTVADFDIKGQLDPVVAAQQAADREISLLEERYKQRKITDEKYRSEKYRLEKELADKIEALNKRGNSGRRASQSDAGPSLRDAVGDKLLQTAQEFSGLSETRWRDNGTLQAFFREAGINIDPKITAWCAAFVNAVLASNGIRGNGALTASSFSDYGTSVDRPQKGDIVVLKPGTAGGTTGHVGFYAGKGEKGGVMVTSGNDSNKVTTREYAMDRVSSFRRVPNADQQSKLLEAQDKAAEQFEQSLGQVALIMQRISGEFDDQPRLIDRANLAAEKLSMIIKEIDEQLAGTDLGEAQRKALEETRAEAVKTQKVVEEGKTRPLRDALQISEEQRQIDNLIIQGREVEAEILSRILAIQERQGPITDDQAANVARVVVQERLRSFELEKQRQLQQQQLDIVSQTQDNIRTSIRELLEGKGIGAIGNFFQRAFDTYLEGLSNQLAESLFGDIFRNQRMKILGLDQVDEAGREMAVKMNRTARSLDALTDAANGAAGALSKTAANDNATEQPGVTNNADIVVNAGKRSINATMKSLGKDLLKNVFGDKMAGQISGALTKAFQGAAIGQSTSGMLKSLGLKQSKLGSQIGGTVGNFVGGPIGAAIGGAIGGTIGGLLKKTPKGSTSISNVDGNLGFSGSGKLRDSVLGLGGNVQSGIANIIESLGGTAGAFNVSIGQRGKSFVVDSSGAGKTKGSNVQKFKTEAEAVRAAILDAINDGAVQGIRAGAQRLLQAGQDLDKALQKAVKFQSVFDRLDAIKDPIGSAIRTLNREFSGLISIFKEAGSSAEEFAQLEELYGLERARIIKETTQQVSGALRQLIDDLKTGDNGLDLRTRLSNARAIFDPMANTIRSGGTVDYEAFAQAARTVLDLQRQIDGSQSGYFSVFNDVIGLSEAALARQQATIAAAAGSASPFTSTTASNDNTPVVGAINSQTTQLLTALDAINSNFANLTNLSNVNIPNVGGNFRLTGTTNF